MNGSAVQIATALVTLVLGAALEELLPKFLGVGFPFLLVAALHFAAHRSRLAATVFAVAAGAFEDALSGLPPMTSVSAFLAATLSVGILGHSRTSALAVYPAYQLWLLPWVPQLGASIFNRMLLSVPIGGLTACSVTLALTWLDGKAAIDECA